MSRAIAQQLRALADQLEGGPGGGMVGPGIVAIGNAAINLAEPVNADWQPGLSAQQFSQQGSIVREPSNAPEGMPRRSPAGYPLHYPGVRWDGFGVPIGPAQVMFDDVTFPDDNAVVAYKAASAVRVANLAVHRWPTGPRS
jgi:hypothetical protein